jgi:hypothetical protein
LFFHPSVFAYGLSVCLSARLSAYLFAYLYFCSPIFLSVHLPPYLSVSLSACLSSYLSVCLPVCPLACRLPICMSICLSNGRKDCVWILGKREPYWKPGDLACQEGEKAGSWLQTAEEKRHSKMAKDSGNELATSSRDSYAQSECIVHCTRVIQYNRNRNRVSLYYLFQGNKSFGTSCHLHSSSVVRKVVSSTIMKAELCLKVVELHLQI